MINLKVHFTSIKGRRNNNEDAHNIILNSNSQDQLLNDINFFAIYDGHGGDWVSKYLSKNLPKYYCKKDYKYPFSKEYHNEVFNKLQKEILKDKNGQISGSTCLLNLMYKLDNNIHMNFVNLGDCRAVIVYDNGSFKQVTTDHKPDDINEKKRIEDMKGEIYEDTEGIPRVGDLSVSRSFGDGDNAPFISFEPDVHYHKVVENTKYIVMGCDGLWDVIENKNLYKILENIKKENKKNLAVELVNTALNKDSHDNISVIVIEII